MNIEYVIENTFYNSKWYMYKDNWLLVKNKNGSYTPLKEVGANIIVRSLKDK